MSPIYVSRANLSRLSSPKILSQNPLTPTAPHLQKPHFQVNKTYKEKEED